MLPLTTLNSVIAVVQLAQDLKPDARVTREGVAVSVGLLNLVGVPLGGMPMCHGAGGLAGQWRFGSRSCVSVLILGVAKMAVRDNKIIIILISVATIPRIGTILRIRTILFLS
ncbi:hypothetical protein T492DRAFT_914257 [Pavlovales sp. CCMP2436]|nr:hypothetical protein T492DRAFT_914257 [Pavlovales sp. CCMP2436]